MTLVNLGDFPSNAPLPTGKGYGYYCPDAGAEWTYNNTVPAGNLVGGQMGVFMTPERDCRWHVFANCIWRSPDDIWSRVDWGLHLNRPDMDGWTDHYSLNWAHGNTIDWQHGTCEGMFRLQAGVAYSCYLYFYGSTNNNQIVYTTEHLTIGGYVLDEGGV